MKALDFIIPALRLKIYPGYTASQDIAISTHSWIYLRGSRDTIATYRFYTCELCGCMIYIYLFRKEFSNVDRMVRIVITSPPQLSLINKKIYTCDEVIMEKAIG